MRRNVLTTHRLSEHPWCREHIRRRRHSAEEFSFPMNLASCCSEQIDLSESIDVIINIMPPIVFWNMIISVVVVSSWPGFTMDTGNVLFNDALNTFYLRIYGVRHMVKDHSDSVRGNQLPPHRLLFPISSKGSFICTIPQTG